MKVEKQLIRLIEETKTPFTHVAKELNMSSQLFRWYLYESGLTEEHIITLRAWARKQARRYEAFYLAED